MKKNLLFLSVVFVSLFFFTSCENDNTDTNPTSKNEQTIKYTPDNVTDFISLTGKNPNEETGKFRKGGEPQEINVVIFRVKVARASKKCLRGLGFCDFEWVPDTKKQAPSEEEINIKVNKSIDKVRENYQYSYSRKSHKKNVEYSYVYLKKEMPSNFPKKLLTLIVDSRLSTSINGVTFILSKGKYNYDSKLGKYGGYKIPLEVEVK